MTDAKGIVDMLTDSAFIQDHWMQEPKVFSAHGLFEEAINKYLLTTWIDMYANRSINSVEYIEAGAHWKIHKHPFFKEDGSLENISAHIETIAEKQTLLLRDLEFFSEFYDQITRSLAKIFEADGKVGMFLSLNGTAGLPKHHDRYHIFVFQHSGSCLWKVNHFYDRRRIALKHELKP